jgi:hypothetical protein
VEQNEWILNTQAATTSVVFTQRCAYTRLQMVWLTFSNDIVSVSDTTVSSESPSLFMNPSVDAANNVTASLTVGGTVYPNTNSGFKNLSQEYLTLQSAVGKPVNIDLHAYSYNADTASSASATKKAFALVWDLRPSPCDPSSAITTRPQEDLNFKLTNLKVASDSATTGLGITITSFYSGAFAIYKAGEVIMHL